MRLMYLLSIASATKTIRLQSAYFVPDELAVETFRAARKRGVKIEIIVPGPHSDAKMVQSASRSLWGELLDAGVEIYEYQPTMYHCKVMIVDDLWVSVGSTNFDDRSFRLNDEANLNIYDSDFAVGTSESLRGRQGSSHGASAARNSRIGRLSARWWTDSPDYFGGNSSEYPRQFSFWHLGWVGRVAPSRADGCLFHNSKAIQSARDGATRPTNPKDRYWRATERRALPKLWKPKRELLRSAWPRLILTRASA